MSKEPSLIEVGKVPFETAMPLEAKRQRLGVARAELRKRLEELVDGGDLDDGTAQEVLAGMDEKPDFRHVWKEVLEDWKEEALEWAHKAQAAVELRDLLEAVESGWWSVHHAEVAALQQMRAG